MFKIDLEVTKSAIGIVKPATISWMQYTVWVLATAIKTRLHYFLERNC